MKALTGVSIIMFLLSSVSAAQFDFAAPNPVELESITDFAGLKAQPAEQTPEPLEISDETGVNYENAESVKEDLIKIIIANKDSIEKAETALIKIFAYAHSKGMLEPAVVAMLNDPRMQKFLPPLPEAKRQDYIRKFPTMIAAQLEGTSYVPGVEGFESWESMAQRHAAIINSSKFSARPAGQPSLLSERGFISELEKISGAEFRNGNTVKYLVDGPASFAERENIIKKAKHSVYMMVWAFYDDITGETTTDLFIAKKKQGVDVKVMVDGNIANFIGMNSLKKLTDAGIEVVRFSDPARKYDGMHAKLLVTDGEHAITGGMNIGDKYSHMNPSGHKWRDTDVLFSGPVVRDAFKIFRNSWNEQVTKQGLPYAPVKDNPPVVLPKGAVKASLVYQRPDKDPLIHLSILKVIYGATKRINIENAYFIAVPSIKTALIDAVSRGVEVNILTNSSESCNEPIITAPILESLAEMITAGVNVYVKTGETLHSKFLTADSAFAALGSYNFHPKGIRYEREITLNILDKQATDELDGIFYKDAGQAKKITKIEELGIPKSPLNFLVRRYMYNQL
ncbi:MAG: phosphatidylserine/phosphatidylglycerophosphate/cardiolipin synthase family protein [Elusimicrobia bacterium]|nr:phosphatidylserine/phosphatidylglycerophosphate/cardiolipin synthase family protein [Elusimicrobiota bacterium]